MKTFSIEEGLSQSTVHSFFQDHLGIMWIGTQDGLNRYDGYDITIFRPDPLDVTSIAGKTITAIEEDSEGRIWLATESDGLNRYDRTTGVFEHFVYEADDSTSLGNNEVFSLLSDSRGTIWVGTAGSGLNRYLGEDQGFRKYSIPDPFGSGEAWIYNLFESSDGSILIATDGAGLFRLDLATDRLARLPVIDPDSGDRLDDVVFEISEDADGWLWLATPRGLISYHMETLELRQFLHEEGNHNSLADDVVFAVEVDDFNRVWAGTAINGLSILNESRTEFQQFQGDDISGAPAPDRLIYTMLLDHAGGMWVGTESGGALLVTPALNVFENLTKDVNLGENLTGWDVWSVLKDRSGDIWIGTSDGGINRLNGTTGKLSRLPVSNTDPRATPDAVATALFEDSKGRLWIGMEKYGVVRSDPAKNRFTKFQKASETDLDFYEDLPHRFFEDGSGRIWMGTSGGGLNLFHEDSGRFEQFVVHPDSLSDWNEVHDIAQSSDGKLWLATLNGVISFDPDTGATQHYPASPSDPNGLSDPVVYSIHVASANEMWLGTDSGLNRMYRPTTGEGPDRDWKFERFSVSDGLPNDVIYSILPGDKGLLWLSTNRGIAAFDRVAKTIRSFDPGDGISGYEFNQGAFAAAENGVLLFGGIGGVTIVNTSQFVESTYEPPVVVTDIRAFEELIDSDLEDGQTIDLLYDQNFVTLSFAAIEFQNPEKIRYRYYLEGSEQDWQEANQRRYVSYAALSPGDYVFHIQSTNTDGLWSTSSTSVNINVSPPFWGTLWFRLIFLSALILSSVAGAWLWRRSGLKKLDRLHREKIDIQRRIGDRLEAERIHLARELHDGPIQSLQLSGFQVTQIEASGAEDEKHERLDGLRQTISSVITDLRNICGQMRPPALVHFGLGRAVQSYAEQFLMKYPDINLHLNLPSGRTQLPERARLGLFRICQEALSNIAKHAGPCQVTITLREEAQEVILEIEDDGVGFELPSAWESLARDQHFGLLGASERAAALNGKLRVHSIPGRGTKIRVFAPISTLHRDEGRPVKEEVLL